MKFNSSLLIIFALVIILIICIFYLIFNENKKNNWFSGLYENYDNYNNQFINPYKDYTISELIIILLKIYSDYKYVIDKLNEMKTNNKIDSNTYDKMIQKLNKIYSSIFNSVSETVTKNSLKFQNILNGAYSADTTSQPPTTALIPPANPTVSTPLPTPMPTALNSSPTGQNPPTGQRPPSPPPPPPPTLNNDLNKKAYYIKDILIPIIQSINSELQNLNKIKTACEKADSIIKFAKT